VATALPAEELLSLAARNDSALVWALVLHRLREGDELGQALADTVLDVAAASPASRLNLLLTDGDQIAATAWGDTLWYLNDPGAGDRGSDRGPHPGRAGLRILRENPASTRRADRSTHLRAGRCE
jgi:hypothetical protein